MALGIIDFFANLLGLGKSATDLAAERSKQNNSQEIKGNEVKKSDAEEIQQIEDDLDRGDADAVGKDFNDT